MTDPVNNSEEYWYIRVPKARASEPQFHFFDRIGTHWTDDEGNHYYDIGEIIGIKNTVKGDRPGQWTYLMRYLKCDFEQSLNGLEDDYFLAESCLVPDDTVIENNK